MPRNRIQNVLMGIPAGKLIRIISSVFLDDRLLVNAELIHFD